MDLRGGIIQAVSDLCGGICRVKNKYTALFLGWLVPGLGHIYAGKRWKGAVIFSVIMAASLVGLAMGRFRSVYFAAAHYQFYAEIGNGLFTIVAALVMKATGAVAIEHTARGGYLAGTLPIADLYLMVAGLLNFVAAANAFDLAAGHKVDKE